MKYVWWIQFSTRTVMKYNQPNVNYAEVKSCSEETCTNDCQHNAATLIFLLTNLFNSSFYFMECDFVDVVRSESNYKGHVVSNGSFSKIVAPGMRLGWLEAPKIILDKIIYRFV